MKELTAVNPYTFDGTEKRGMCPFETAKKIRKLWADNSKKFEEEFGCPEYPERVVSSIPFEEQPFGSLVDEPAECDDNDTPRPTIVSLALFDQDEMLSACTGIALPDGTSSIHLTRILTSARLVTVFNEKRNRDDELRIEVGVPHHHPFNGFLELYDDDIAIVTSLTLPNIFPVDLDLQEASLPAGTEVSSTGRAFKSDLMVANGRLVDDPSGDGHKHLRVSDCHITEDGLGGPLTDSDRNFIGLNINCAVGKTWFLPRKLIRERLEQFQILILTNMQGGDYAVKEHANDLYGAGSARGTAKTSSQGYSPPLGASTIVPSGFLRKQKWLDSVGYPKPPALMLECKLIEVFLPPNQRVSGTLVAYDSYYNLAIVGAEGLRVICPEDVLLVDTSPDQSRDRELRIMCREETVLKNVVAIGRDPEQGLLCGSMGVVSKEPVTHGCEELKLSTCKIKKAGIGGPLINLDGSFVGMNFYDGRHASTPFLPKRYIIKVLQHTPREKNKLNDRYQQAVQRLDSPDDGKNYSSRWPVPKARWYNSILEVDRPDSVFQVKRKAMPVELQLSLRFQTCD